MYSVILMTAMTGHDVPQGLFFNRDASSCAGRTTLLAAPIAPRVRLFAPTGCGGAHFAPLATFEANRPHVIRSIFGHLPHPFRRASAGCGGAALAQDCGGVTVGLGQATPAFVAGGPLGNLITRAAVHRQLIKALTNPSLTPAQRAVASATLADPDLYDAAVIKVTRDLKRVKAPLTFNASAFGDGHILQLLIDNLPAIIAAIEQIIKLFAMGAITEDQMYALIDQLLEPIRFLV